MEKEKTVQESKNSAGTIYFDKNQLDNFIKEKVNPTQYLCNQCNYKSSRRNRIELHVKAIHFEIKDFECSDCNKAFS